MSVDWSSTNNSKTDVCSGAGNIFEKEEWSVEEGDGTCKFECWLGTE